MTKNKPKVLYFHMEYPPILGGGASYTKNLTDELSQLEAEIILITNGKKDRIEKVNKKLTIKRYKVFHDMYYGKEGLLKGVDILLQQIREEAPDILHTVYIQETLIGKIANLNYGVPHIVTHTKTPMHREESIIKNSTWSLFDYVNKNKSVTYVAPGLAYRSSLLQSGVNNPSINLIYAGIDQERFKKIKDKKRLERLRKRLKIKQSDSIILIPCMLRKRKGLPFVAKALSELSMPNHNLKVIITGIPRNKREKLIYKKFKNLIGNVELVQHERFSDADMPILYNIADVTVLCSKAEGYGTVFLEAMACECPVIGSDVIGINEVIADGYNGILCKYGDHKTLNKAIKKVLTDPETRNKFIENSLNVLKSKYNIHKQAKKHLELYKTHCINKQPAICVLYRFKEDSEEVFLLKKDKSNYGLPKTFKKINESWLQATIKKTRKVSDYKVIIPSHLIPDETDKNRTAYSFQVINDTPIIRRKRDNRSRGIWLELNIAKTLVKNKYEKNILQELNKKIENDKQLQQSNCSAYPHN